MKRVVIYDQEGYDCVPRGLVEFSKWASQLLASVPEQCMNSAKIEIEAYDSYGSSTITVLVYYDRQLTPDEQEEEKAKQARSQEALKARELQTLAFLQSKYGHGKPA